jgi:endonuclease/exonuclease/phosphatase family metal-dependent hydrolase
MTLNLAHGRATGVHQALEKRSTIEAHLDKIGQLLRRERPDVVAFQEADGPSFWSGEFNHVEYLAHAAEYPHFFRGEHVRGLGLSYGTALVSRLPLAEAVSHTFAASPPTPPKGFVVARVTWPGRPGLRLNVVSVHLDFSLASVRKEQIAELAEHLAKREGPTIVLGDFNSQWSDRESAVRALAERLSLRAYQPAAADMATFPETGKRLDWILISPPLEFLEYRTLPDVVSDHRGVVAVLGIRDAAPGLPASDH